MREIYLLKFFLVENVIHSIDYVCFILISFAEECMWQNTELIKRTMNFGREDYAVVDYGYATIPTYPSGQIGFVLCSLSKVSFGKGVYATIPTYPCGQMGFLLHSFGKLRFSKGDALLSLLILVDR